MAYMRADTNSNKNLGAHMGLVSVPSKLEVTKSVLTFSSLPFHSSSPGVFSELFISQRMTLLKALSWVPFSPYWTLLRCSLFTPTGRLYIIFTQSPVAQGLLSTGQSPECPTINTSPNKSIPFCGFLLLCPNLALVASTFLYLTPIFMIP